MPTWDGPEYARVSPGRYSAVAIRVLGPQWVRRYRRWSLMVEFELLSESARVCAFFNMGSNPEKPHAGEQSRYFQAWTLANGERPCRKQGLDPAVFLDGQVYQIEVSDSHTDVGGQRKADALVYSRVSQIVSVEAHNHPITTITQSPQSPESPDSLNQESRIMQSRNQESPNQGGPHGCAPKPGAGHAHAKQTRRAGTEVPARAM